MQETKIDKRIRFLKDIAILISHANENLAISVICFTFYRSPEQQLQEFIKGKSKLKIGPHQSWLAMDLAIVTRAGNALFDPDKERNNISWQVYSKLGDYWKSLGTDHIWGGDWKTPFDPYHFELK